MSFQHPTRTEPPCDPCLDARCHDCGDCEGHDCLYELGNPANDA